MSNSDWHQSVCTGFGAGGTTNILPIFELPQQMELFPQEPNPTVNVPAEFFANAQELEVTESTTI